MIHKTEPNPSDHIDYDLTRILSYAGYVLLTYELLRTMIVRPIKLFYERNTFYGGPFHSYEKDVLTRSKNEFEACLLYLKDFMEAIDGDDIHVIQRLRKHRNDFAHNLPDRLETKHVDENWKLFNDVKSVIFKLSNYRAYMEIGQEPALKGVDWNLAKGHEYLIIERITNNVKLMQKS